MSLWWKHFLASKQVLVDFHAELNSPFTKLSLSSNSCTKYPFFLQFLNWICLAFWDRFVLWPWKFVWGSQTGSLTWGMKNFPPKSLFQCPRWWILNFEVVSYLSFVTALFSYQRYCFKSKGGEDRRKQLNPEAAGFGTYCRTEQLAVKFPSFKSQTSSQKLLLVAALGFQTALHRWTLCSPAELCPVRNRTQG